MNTFGGGASSEEDIALFFGGSFCDFFGDFGRSFGHVSGIISNESSGAVSGIISLTFFYLKR